MKSKEQWVKHGKKIGLSYVFYKGNVINVSRFMDKHPGGDQAIKNYLWKDVTKIFFKVYPHKQDDQQVLLQYKIGNLIEEEVVINPKQKQSKQEKENVNLLKTKLEKRKVTFHQQKYQISQVNQRQKTIKSIKSTKQQKLGLKVLTKQEEQQLQHEGQIENEMLDQLKPQFCIPISFGLKNVFFELKQKKVVDD